MNALHALWEALFPTRCVACRASGEWWCAVCQSQVDRIHRNLCPSCASQKREHDCSHDPALDGLVATGFYHDPKLRSVITSLKYKGAVAILPAIGEFLHHWRDERLDSWPWAGETGLAIQPLVGVPSRVRARGFDQAELISDLVSASIIPWATRINGLQRQNASQTQVSLGTGPLRTANAAGAFSISPGMQIPKTVLLVDDVVTTGATMREAARVLKAAGAEKVYGFALAVGA